MKPATGLTTRLGAVAATIAAIALGLGFSGCNTDPEHTTHVSEGQGMQLGDLLYNVQITRILNPSDAEDKAYLVGQKPPGPNQYYLAVFMRIQNEGDSSTQVPTGFKVINTVGDTFNPIPSKSLFALGLGDTMHPGDELPEPESTAANGPIEGAMVLFRITGTTIQDRPLTLEIPSSAGPTGTVQLDI